MKLRTFNDYLGRRWEVWETNPTDLERRAAERREVPDRRRRKRGGEATERRAQQDRRSQSIPRFPGIPQMQQGWLCFEREGERKRLAPVPEAWERADELTLAALCNFASEKITPW